MATHRSILLAVLLMCISSTIGKLVYYNSFKHVIVHDSGSHQLYTKAFFIFIDNLFTCDTTKTLCKSYTVFVQQHNFKSCL